jgi:crotonobetainyl-CoA:carnitine CoA-transferase CaiB-like acyl-CoA transferase
MSGYSVLDFSQAASGPFCTQALGDLGARVIKVEPPEGDMIRGWNDAFVEGHGTYFMGLNRNKESVCLNLKTRAGLEVARRLIEGADIMVENFRPGVAERLGIGYEACKELNPGLIYLSITGYGPRGPRAQEPAMDIIIQAVGGIMGITGEAGRPPVKVGAPVADIVSGWAALSAVLAATVVREREGIGQHVEISMLDVVITLLSNHATGFLMTGKPVERLGSGHPQLVPYQAFETLDHQFLIVGILNERFWRKFCEAVERPDWLTNERFVDNTSRVKHREEMVGQVEQVIKQKKADEWLARFAEYDVPVTLVATFEALFSDEQVLANGMVQEMQHDKVGPVKVLGTPFHFAATPAALQSAPPLLGEHTRSILAGLGYDRSQIDTLEAEGVIRVKDR